MAKASKRPIMTDKPAFADEPIAEQPVAEQKPVEVATSTPPLSYQERMELRRKNINLAFEQHTTSANRIDKHIAGLMAELNEIKAAFDTVQSNVPGINTRGDYVFNRWVQLIVDRIAIADRSVEARCCQEIWWDRSKPFETLLDKANRLHVLTNQEIDHEIAVRKVE